MPIPSWSIYYVDLMRLYSKKKEYKSSLELYEQNREKCNENTNVLRAVRHLIQDANSFPAIPICTARRIISISRNGQLGSLQIYNQFLIHRQKQDS